MRGNDRNCKARKTLINLILILIIKGLMVILLMLILITRELIMVMLAMLLVIVRVPRNPYHDTRMVSNIYRIAISKVRTFTIG